MNKTKRKYKTDSLGHRVPEQKAADFLIQGAVFFIIAFSIGATHFWNHPIPLKIAVYMYSFTTLYQIIKK